MQHVGYLNVTFSQNKRVVFALQKYGFWRAKRGFLMDKNRVLHFLIGKNRNTANGIAFRKPKSFGDKNGRFFEAKNASLFWKKIETNAKNNGSKRVGEA